MEETEMTVEENNRTAGVLMPLASMPSDEGIGVLGTDSYHFVDLLAQMGMRVWQLLPLTPLGFGNSPYQPFASCAGDPLYISTELLERDGLLAPDSRCKTTPGGERIDYDAVRREKEPLLREACERFLLTQGDSETYRAFCAQDWVRLYGVFLALKRQNGLRPWTEWPEEQRRWIADREYDLRPLEQEIRCSMTEQYLFFRQWQALRSYANSRGIQIMGDLPFYVGLDSLEAWSRRDDFLLDPDGNPAFVAGVPPDYFNAEGQRWGNPIYNWAHMEQDGFSFWLERLRGSGELYDIVRIDHFRAFDTYWKIPADCPTAMVGEWVQAPGRALFERIRRELPDLQIIAEDLGGDLTPGVHALRDDFGLMGMNVADFTLTSGEKPRKNQLAYTGTHDNQTSRGFYESMPKEEKKRFRAALADYGSEREPVSKKMLRYVFLSDAAMAIVPLADILNLGDEARLNTPGTVGSPNWEWRLSDWRGVERKRRFIRELLEQADRA